MSDRIGRTLGERDWLADRVSEWYHDQNAVTDRGFDLTSGTGEFVYEIASFRYEVTIKEIQA